VACEPLASGSFAAATMAAMLGSGADKAVPRGGLNILDEGGRGGPWQGRRTGRGRPSGRAQRVAREVRLP